MASRDSGGMLLREVKAVTLVTVQESVVVLLARSFVFFFRQCFRTDLVHAGIANHLLRRPAANTANAIRLRLGNRYLCLRAWVFWNHIRERAIRSPHLSS
jgi:uncharacterized membrane protein